MNNLTLKHGAAEMRDGSCVLPHFVSVLPSTSFSTAITFTILTSWMDASARMSSLALRRKDLGKEREDKQKGPLASTGARL